MLLSTGVTLTVTSLPDSILMHALALVLNSRELMPSHGIHPSTFHIFNFFSRMAAGIVFGIVVRKLFI